MRQVSWYSWGWFPAFGLTPRAASRLPLQVCRWPGRTQHWVTWFRARGQILVAHPFQKCFGIFCNLDHSGWASGRAGPEAQPGRAQAQSLYAEYCGCRPAVFKLFESCTNCTSRHVEDGALDEDGAGAAGQASQSDVISSKAINLSRREAENVT